MIYFMCRRYQIIMLILCLFLNSGCEKQTPKPQPQTVQSPTDSHLPPSTPASQPPIPVPVEKPTTTPTTAVPNIAIPKPLNFEVENITGKTVYVTCFSYIRKRVNARWQWSKSPIYKLNDNEKTTIDIIQTVYEDDHKNVFGYLGVFDTQKEADDAIYELLQDEDKLDLDLLHKLEGKKVTLNIEHYGFKKPIYEYDFIDKNKKKSSTPAELDFYVLNNTNKTIFLCSFVYLKKAKGSWIAATESKDDMAVWRFDKTKVLKLKPNDYGYIDVDTIKSKRDRSYVAAYLAIFDEDEEKLAQEATFELIDQKRTLHIGNLKDFNNGLVILEIQKYGIMEDIIDFVSKPARKINMTKIIK